LISQNEIQNQLKNTATDVRLDQLKNLIFQYLLNDENINNNSNTQSMIDCTSLYKDHFYKSDNRYVSENSIINKFISDIKMNFLKN